jgi:hypothetical protein
MYFNYLRYFLLSPFRPFSAFPFEALPVLAMLPLSFPTFIAFSTPAFPVEAVCGNSARAPTHNNMIVGRCAVMHKLERRHNKFDVIYDMLTYGTTVVRLSVPHRTNLRLNTVVYLQVRK